MTSLFGQQWDEQDLSKSTYIKDYNTQAYSVGQFDRSKPYSKNELQSKLNELDSIKAEGEEVHAVTHANSSSPKAASFKLKRSFSSVATKESFSKPLHNLEDKEILSVSRFFSVYNDIKIQEKNEEKASLKRSIDSKRQKIQDIHLSNRKLFHRSQTIETSPLAINPSGISSNLSGLKGSVLLKEAENSIKTPTNLRSKPNFTRSNSLPLNQCDFMSLKLSGNKDYTKRFNDKNSKVDDASPTEMTVEQKFNTKEINRHLICMTVSPKPYRPKTASLKEKDKIYNTMFKDHLKMDHNVEVSIQKAQKILLKRASTSQSLSYFLQTEKNLPDSPKSEKEHNKESIQNNLGATHNKDADCKKSILIGKKIKDSIKNIDKILKSNSSSVNTQNQKASVFAHHQRKNRLPLRSAIVEKYNFEEKLKDHKAAATKMKNTSNVYQKQANKSGMTNQGYTSYYH